MNSTEKCPFLRCSCGNPARPNQRTCAECHRANERTRRDVRCKELAQFKAWHSDRNLYVDKLTKQHFDLHIWTSFVEVLTYPPELDYIALPIGYLPGDEIVIWHDGIINIVQLKQLRNLKYGSKR